MTTTRREMNEPVLAEWIRGSGQSAIQEMMAVANRPDVLSLALGLPAAELFPVRDYARAAQHVLETDPLALQYSLPSQSLKAHVVELMARRGVACREEEVFLTAGAQQGVSLLARLLLDHGGRVLCEEVVYTGMRQAVEPYSPAFVTVPTDAWAGVDVEAVERELRRARPAFIYLIPDGHNPLCVSLSEAKRARLAELAREYGVPIIEDDPYGFISYEPEPARPLRAYDADWVFYVGTFSKLLAPALRVGWLVVPRALTARLSIIKEASDINTCTFNQRAVAAYLDAGHLAGHSERLRDAYRERRDAMLDALREHFPEGSLWRRPSHGLFVWVELPEPVDMGALLRDAVTAERVAFIPGQAFAVRPEAGASRGMRLNFSKNDPAQIAEGVRRLGRAVSRVLSARPQAALCS